MVVAAVGGREQKAVAAAVLEELAAAVRDRVACYAVVELSIELQTENRAGKGGREVTSPKV
jgi:hypothetical protein